MDAEALKEMCGSEYPAAVLQNGVRMPLSLETRFTRSYSSVDDKTGFWVSRFMDGSASMTADELRRHWSHWTSEERVDFCQSCVWLHKQADYSEMLRCVMHHGAPDQWSAVAVNVASDLPREEAFDFLLDALGAIGSGICSNIIQGIAITKHPEAEATLRDRLRIIWANPKLWDDDDFLNWVASDATCCIQYLIELGAPPADFEEQARRLSEHHCEGNRDSCRRWLSQYYSFHPSQN